MKILFTFIPSEKLQNEIQAEFPEHEFHFCKMKSAGSLAEEAEIYVTYGEDLDNSYIEKAKNLKWIMVMSAGMDRMPFEECAKRDILVTNVRGIHKIPMAEFTLGTMLQHVKQYPLLQRKEQQEDWDRKVKVEELAGKNLLVLGIGAIGGETARLAKAFRMTVTGINRSGKQHEYADQTDTFANISAWLPQADFVLSVLPSTYETRYLLEVGHFKLMKDSAVFINIGRGDLVKEEVLLKVMEERMIAHAYLDVFKTEPLPKGHPFWKMDNVTVTPPLSSITRQYLPRSFEIFKHNLRAYVNKEENFINGIDLSRGY
ncbi:D-2-hydroxyacid dehydrogenase [Neobacillus notoginsengisoli]|uniref:D-2-hydroxyacid dehydrogenase n=1 Tax=Neobacillus notoginsengisoli TaxID=1578198 RepID=A0A417YJE9_9BACI|nr:D-2-hydroxyacid dehydrogenase [Neobacillus notoginsengisoli]RHW33293.1 D-2-hydroxyacid dehydrogenase [Neobacillus notoginsengisoli]